MTVTIKTVKPIQLPAGLPDHVRRQIENQYRANVHAAGLEIEAPAPAAPGESNGLYG